MNFLELCQATARESGTIAGAGLQPLSVVGQADRLGKIVHWTAQAWLLIQQMHEGWLFHHGEYSGELVPGVSRYAGVTFGHPDVAAWAKDHRHYKPHSAYPVAAGIEQERPLTMISWETWRHRYGRGPQAQGFPSEYAISPSQELCVGPVPDQSYAIRGEYQRMPQRLVDNADIPRMPEQFHDTIYWRAVMLLDEHDEALEAVRVGRARNSYTEMIEAMKRSQLPDITWGFRSIA